MTGNPFFSLKRFFMVLKHDIIINYKSALFITGAFMGLILIMTILSTFFDNLGNIHLILYPVTLFGGGYIFTSIIFSDVNDPKRGYSFLMLPASLFEKYLSKFLLTTLGYFVVSTIIYFLMTSIANGMLIIVWGAGYEFFFPVSDMVSTSALIYITPHSIFFLGAIAFKRLNFIKTVLSVSVFLIIIAVLVTLFFKLLFWEHFESDKVITVSNEIFKGTPSVILFNETVAGIIGIFYTFIFPVALWTAAFFKLKEKEV